MKFYRRNVIFLIIFILKFYLELAKDEFSTKKNKHYKRKLADDDEESEEMPDFVNGPFEQLKFHFDLINFNEDFEETSYSDRKVDFINAMDKSAEILESLLKIYKSNQNAIVSTSSLTNNGVSTWDTTLYDNVGDSVNYDFNYGIFFAFANLNNDDLPAITKIISFDGYSIPRFGIMKFNTRFPFINVSSDFLKKLFLHEFIHLLGFHKDNDYFSDLVDDSAEKSYLVSSNVIEFAKKYFNCPTITKLEINIENDIPHWPSRILLGELMTDFFYSEEQVISGFTLALFKDFQYLQITNSYTGGLMRFGKHKGCDFLEKKCIGDLDSNGNKIKFENEFYYPLNYDTSNIGKDSIKPSCSSGRLSKTIYKLKNYEGDPIIDDIIPYFSEADTYGGSPYTEYCPISYFDTTSAFTVGSCSNTANTANTEMGENFSDSSFCSLSSLKKTDVQSTVTQLNAVCFKMHCSSQSLTIQFGEDDFFVCPREGGKINGVGFVGYLLCPDYNLICTSNQLCNDLFKCISENSIEKEETFNYDYEIKTTQDPNVYENLEISSGWELTSEGTCPQYCSQCDKDKKCFKCGLHYELQDEECVEIVPNCLDYFNDETCKKCKDEYILVEEENEKICKLSNFDISQYHSVTENGSTYYRKCSKSINHCYKCTSANFCSQCENNYGIIGDDASQCKDLSTNLYYKDTEDYNKYKLCSTKYPNCQKCTQNINNIVNCIECDTEFNLVNNGGTDQCQSKAILENDNSLFRDNINGIYYSCSNIQYHSVSNCLKCQNKDTCTDCQSGYGLFYSGKMCISTSEKEYFKNATDNYYYLCSKQIRGCEKCNDRETCIECSAAFEIDINNKCIPLGLALTKYYKDEATGKYISCSTINNCDECISSTECTRCKSGYKLNENLCIIENESGEEGGQEPSGGNIPNEGNIPNDGDESNGLAGNNGAGENKEGNVNKGKDDNALSIAAIILGTIGTIASIFAIIFMIFKNIFFNKSLRVSDATVPSNVNGENNNEIYIQTNRRTIHNEPKSNGE